MAFTNSSWKYFFTVTFQGRSTPSWFTSGCSQRRQANWGMEIHVFPFLPTTLKILASDSLFHPLSCALFSSNATFVHPDFFSIKSTCQCVSSQILSFFVTSLTFQMKGFNRLWACRPQWNWMPYNLVNSFSLSMWSCVEGARSAIIKEESEWYRLNSAFKLLLWHLS